MKYISNIIKMNSCNILDSFQVLQYYVKNMKNNACYNLKVVCSENIIMYS